jgi:hypothetical protein
LAADLPIQTAIKSASTPLEPRRRGDDLDRPEE